MELTASQKKTVQRQFDSFCKKVLREEARDYIRHYVWLSKHEEPLSLLSEETRLCYIDQYPSNYERFKVLGYSIAISDDRLTVALCELSNRRREIVLLSYFMDMTDREISERLRMKRYTVQRERKRALSELKNRMGVRNEKHLR